MKSKGLDTNIVEDDLTNLLVEFDRLRLESEAASALAKEAERRVQLLRPRIKEVEERLSESLSTFSLNPGQTKAHKAKTEEIEIIDTGFKDAEGNSLFAGDHVHIRRYTKGLYKYKSQGTVVESHQDLSLQKVWIKVDGISKLTLRSSHTITKKKTNG